MWESTRWLHADGDGHNAAGTDTEQPVPCGTAPTRSLAAALRNHRPSKPNSLRCPPCTAGAGGVDPEAPCWQCDT